MTEIVCPFCGAAGVETTCSGDREPNYICTIGQQHSWSFSDLQADPSDVQHYSPDGESESVLSPHR